MNEETPLISSLRYYDKEGQPIPIERWLALHSNEEYSIVGRDEVGEVIVSTVWIGYKPMFETMVFWISSHVRNDGEEVVHYRTLAEAEAGHLAMVERIRHEMGR